MWIGLEVRSFSFPSTATGLGTYRVQNKIPMPGPQVLQLVRKKSSSGSSKSQKSSLKEPIQTYYLVKSICVSVATFPLEEMLQGSFSSSISEFTNNPLTRSQCAFSKDIRPTRIRTQTSLHLLLVLPQLPACLWVNHSIFLCLNSTSV